MTLTSYKSEPDMTKALPPIPSERDVPSNLEYYHPEQFSHLDPSRSVERSRIPLIVLAQQQQGYSEPDPEEYENPPRQWRLSTITEKSERTEFTPRWAHSQQLMTPSRGPALSSISSYGEIVGERGFPSHLISHLVKIRHTTRTQGSPGHRPESHPSFPLGISSKRAFHL